MARSVSELKAALKAYGCSTAGNKGVLQSRLRAALADAAVSPPLNPGKLVGLTLAEKKRPIRAAATSSEPPPLREVPEEGSPILEVHSNYQQVGCRDLTKVVVANDGVTVYNAHFSQVDTGSNTNRECMPFEYPAPSRDRPYVWPAHSNGTRARLNDAF